MEKMETKETIVYGGAFNPPTLAHVAILNACISYAETKNADVWLLPSGDRSDKTIATSREIRMAYLEAMIADAEASVIQPRIITTELDRDHLIETYETVQELQGMHLERNFTYVFGADSTQTMASWHGGEELLETLPMLVIDRPGSEVNPLARHAVRLQVSTPDVSSTLVRARLAEGGSVKELVGASVAQLLQ